MWGGRIGVVTVVVLGLLGGCGGDDEAPAEDAAPAAAGEDGVVRYLSIGDSLTQGVGAPDESTGAFPVVLAERWREDGCEVEVRNVGVSGSTVPQMVDEQVPAVEEASPTFVTFQGGANDIVYGVTDEEYREAVGTVLDTAVGAGARVVVLAQNEWFRAPAAPDYGDVTVFEERRADLDEILLAEAEERGAELVDLRDRHSADADAGRWVEDGIHPTAEVYAEWADEIADAVGSPCG